MTLNELKAAILENGTGIYFEFNGKSVVLSLKFRTPYLHLPCGMETALRTIPISMNCCLMVSLMASRLSIFLTSSNRVSIEFKMES